VRIIKRQGRFPLSLRVKRSIERELGVFLAEPKNPKRSTNEQIGVYDQEEEYVGDIIANTPFFTRIELEKKINALFKKVNKEV